MQRLRLVDCRLSRLPTVIGKCSADINSVADFVNTAQRRLLYAREAGDEGWWGTWAEMAFNVSRANPFITVPREVARLELVDICQNPRPIQNQFYEYLQFGNGRLPKLFRRHLCFPHFQQVFTRNTVPTFMDIPTGTTQIIQIIASNPNDTSGIKRILVQGLDQNGMTVYSQDGPNQVQGIFVPLASPLATVPFPMTQITGIQKDVTDGPVQVIGMDTVSGVQTPLVTMEPSETTAWYRRYYFDHLPFFGCCPAVPAQTVIPLIPVPVQVTAIVKLDLIPVMFDTDYLLLQNLEAVIEECQSIRYSEIDSTSAKQMAQERHKQAIGMLNGELTHFLGRDDPAVLVQRFGSARLNKIRIGMI